MNISIQRDAGAIKWIQNVFFCSGHSRNRVLCCTATPGSRANVALSSPVLAMLNRAPMLETSCNWRRDELEFRGVCVQMRSRVLYTASSRTRFRRGHLVAASGQPLPVPLHRLARSGVGLQYREHFLVTASYTIKDFHRGASRLKRVASFALREVLCPGLVFRQSTAVHPEWRSGDTGGW
jgi:hypothetical protein